MLVVHPGQGRCRPVTAEPAPEWRRLAVCIHGDLVVCGQCGELGIIPREGLGHMMELQPGLTPEQAQAAMAEGQPPHEAVSSPQGEDRSHYQPVGPWGPDSFGIVKATEGITFADPAFGANWANLKAEGKPRGAYHYFHPSLSPIDQAHFFVSTVNAHGGFHDNDMACGDFEILVGADGTTLEYADEHAVARSHLQGAPLGSVASGSVLGNAARIFLDEVRSLTGLRQRFLLSYTNLSVGAYLAPVASAGYWLWLAYPGSSFPSGSVWPWTHATTRLWQWQFGGGYGGGDRDAFMGDSAALAAYFDVAPPPPPPPAPAHLPSMTGDDVFYLPNGKDAKVMLGIPEFLPGTATPPSVLYFSVPSAVTLQWEKGIDSGDIQALLVDALRSPQALPLSDLAPGQKAIRIMRAGGASEDSTLVTCYWA